MSKEVKKQVQEKVTEPKVKKVVAKEQEKVEVPVTEDVSETLELEKDTLKPEEIPEIEKENKPKARIGVEGWVAKTSIGRRIQAGEITDINQVFDSGEPILEAEIVESLLPNIQSELLMIGQSKGKFGGGSRRIFRQTQKKTPEGNKPSFACMAVCGDGNGHIGVGYGKSKDTVPSREKAIRKAKISLFKIRRGSGSWEDTSTDPHSIPFSVSGKCGSVIIELYPAPKGKGLVVEKECAKVLKLAGIENIYSKTYGRTKSKVNLLKALVAALKKLNAFKPRPNDIKVTGLLEGSA